jgi:hypothetical protein
MRSSLLSLSSLISASFLVDMWNSAITTMIGDFVAETGGDQSDVALIASCYSVGFLAPACGDQVPPTAWLFQPEVHEIPPHGDL